MLVFCDPPGSPVWSGLIDEEAHEEAEMGPENNNENDKAVENMKKRSPKCIK